MRALTLDIETVDPYIGLGLGSGWVYPTGFEVLGIAVITSDNKSSYITDNVVERVRKLLREHDTLIMHNAQYDLGGLIHLGLEDELGNMTIYDTEVMGRLHDSSLMSHSLDALGERYLNVRKSNKLLADTVYKHRLYPLTKTQEKDRQRHIDRGMTYEWPRQKDATLLRYAKTHMKEIQSVAPDVIAQYAIKDVALTKELFTLFSREVDIRLAARFSRMALICAVWRKSGVRIDLDRCRELQAEMAADVAEAYEKLYDLAGTEFNINSGPQVAKVFDDLDIKYPTTPAGNPSITTPWLKQQRHEVCLALMEVRKVLKIKNEFIDKVIEMQEYTCPEAGRYGRLYPELNLLRASTGRFSSRGPNIQQIPARDEKYGPLCRSIYVAEEGERWYSLDFSSQEGRLQIHYADRLGCDGASELVRAYVDNPRLDMHQKVADMASITRDQAKVIGLGISYGMGIKKLAESLGTSVPQAQEILSRYSTLAPYLTDLDAKCKDAITRRGYIRTIGGRDLKLDPPMFDPDTGRKRTFEYKALNKLIQGSAADQTIFAMEALYERGVRILFPVHDQICLSGSLEDALAVKEEMERSVDLNVPSIVDVDLEGGISWADAGH